MEDEENVELRSLGERAFRRRRSLKLKQEHIAKAAGRTRHWVGQFERGEVDVKYSDLVAVAGALRMTVAELSGEEPVSTDSEDAPLTMEEEAQFAYYDARFQSVAMARGQYDLRTPAGRRAFIRASKLFSDDVYREPIEDEA